ncbi:MAG: hypothetical protein V4717_24425 [Bacteroidota bacterium]
MNYNFFKVLEIGRMAKVLLLTTLIFSSCQEKKPRKIDYYLSTALLKIDTSYHKVFVESSLFRRQEAMSQDDLNIGDQVWVGGMEIDGHLIVHKNMPEGDILGHSAVVVTQ